MHLPVRPYFTGKVETLPHPLIKLPLQGSWHCEAMTERVSKSAEHKKSFSGATWIFCMEPNCFGIIKGEQPLIRASRASKVAETLPR